MSTAVVGHSIINIFFLLKSSGATALPAQMVVTPLSVGTRTHTCKTSINSKSAENRSGHGLTSHTNSEVPTL